ncbi:L,D-transpeptidase family protein [Mucilaginibacter endophyticus]|uniref:L,D-transpeptidase family protein n=1 Tax=Mucilaginibacter endophyticus TaxID=2675003 RepID=UPI001ABEECDB|nr:L,D-transpeptidase family protein [Mucilaginibacter endophyticus]
MKLIPTNIDTTILVRDNAGVLLNFRQYMPVLLRNEGMIYREKETLRLQRFTTTAIDSLNKDDYAISRWDRWAAIRGSHSKSPDEILKNLAAICATADSVIVYKSARTMYLRKNGKNLFQFRISLGRNPRGNKISDGDSRTPQGVYYLDNKTDRDDKYYKSFWISYPNQADRTLALKRGVKPGVGVMIHGTPSQRDSSTDWTNGCIALINTDMDTLFKYVMPGTLIDIRK